MFSCFYPIDPAKEMVPRRKLWNQAKRLYQALPELDYPADRLNVSYGHPKHLLDITPAVTTNIRTSSDFLTFVLYLRIVCIVK